MHAEPRKECLLNLSNDSGVNTSLPEIEVSTNFVLSDSEHPEDSLEIDPALIFGKN